MTSTAQAVDHAATAASVSSEKRDTIMFFVIVAALLGAIVAAGLVFGLAGVGAIAIAGAGAMLLICVLLTAG